MTSKTLSKLTSERSKQRKRIVFLKFIWTNVNVAEMSVFIDQNSSLSFVQKTTSLGFLELHSF